MKKCYKCNIEKPKEKFHRDKTRNDGLHNFCKDCTLKQNKKHYNDNKEYYKDYYNHNIESRKYYYQDNKEKIQEYSKQYNKLHPNTFQIEYYTNPIYRLKLLLRNRTYLAFRDKGYSKNSKTRDMLGADWEVVKTHIESQFRNNMNWENQGEWEIDHIIPLSSANNEEELIKLCHYTNLQPLWFFENRQKGIQIGWNPKI
jgi:hypothetical protein